MFDFSNAFGEPRLPDCKRVRFFEHIPPLNRVTLLYVRMVADLFIRTPKNLPLFGLNVVRFLARPQR